MLSRRVQFFLTIFFFRVFFGTVEEFEFEIKPKNCVVGLICAALFEKQWHRARIIEIFLNTDQVKLLYIDYGTVMTISIKEIKYLHKDFADVPSMIYRGCLSNIKPMQTRFSSSATQCFHSKVSDKLLAGQATYIDFDEQIVYMLLIDTTTDQDFCINNHLFERGFARLTDIEDRFNEKTKVS